MSRTFGLIALRVLRGLLPLWCLFLLAAITTSIKEAFITCIFMGYGLHLIFKIIVAIDASRRMSEDRQTGALELLLVTPIPIRSIISGHQIALRTHFWRPFVLLLSVNLMLFLVVLFLPDRLHMHGRDQAIFCELFLGGALMLFLDFYAFQQLGIWLGLKAKRHHRAVAGSLLRIMGLPWLAAFLITFVGVRSATQAATLFAIWFAVGIVIDAAIMLVMRQKLPAQFRATLSFSVVGADGRRL
jgi:hypothetical protein